MEVQKQCRPPPMEGTPCLKLVMTTVQLLLDFLSTVKPKGRSTQISVGFRSQTILTPSCHTHCFCIALSAVSVTNYCCQDVSVTNYCCQDVSVTNYCCQETQVVGYHYMLCSLSQPSLLPSHHFPERTSPYRSQAQTNPPTHCPQAQRKNQTSCLYSSYSWGGTHLLWRGEPLKWNRTYLHREENNILS